MKKTSDQLSDVIARKQRELLKLQRRQKAEERAAKQARWIQLGQIVDKTLPDMDPNYLPDYLQLASDLIDAKRWTQRANSAANGGRCGTPFLRAEEAPLVGDNVPPGNGQNRYGGEEVTNDHR